MKRTFLIPLILLVVSGWVLGSYAKTARAEEVTKWEFYTGHALSPSGPTGVLGGGLMDMADEIYRATRGKIKVKVLAKGEHPYKPQDALTLMRDLKPAMLEMGFAQATGQDPRLAVADLPMLFPPEQALFYEITDELMRSYFGPILAEYGYQPFVTFSWTPQRIGGRDFFVTSWDSLKGKKIRTWNPQLSDWVKLVGGKPVSVPFPEVYTALQTGLVDGVISSSGGMGDLGWGEICKNITMMEVQFGIVSFVVNQKALSALPDDVRKDFLSWAEKAQPRARKVYEANVALSTLAAVTKLGCSIRRPSPDFWQEVRSKCGDAVWKRWIKRSGGAGSPAERAFNQIANKLREMGHKVPYTP